MKNKKKIIIMSLIAVVVLVSAVICVGYATGEEEEKPFDVNDPLTWYKEAQDGGIDDSLTQKITVDMKIEEVVEILGKAQRDVGSGVPILQWDLKSGKVFNVNFNPYSTYFPDGTYRQVSWIAFHVSIEDVKTEHTPIIPGTLTPENTEIAD